MNITRSMGALCAVLLLSTSLGGCSTLKSAKAKAKKVQKQAKGVKTVATGVQELNAQTGMFTASSETGSTASGQAASNAYASSSSLDMATTLDQAMTIVNSQTKSDAIVRPQSHSACQRLYDNYRIMSAYKTQSVAVETPVVKKTLINKVTGVLSSTLEVAGGVAGIVGVSGGTDTLLKASQTTSAMNGANTIVGLVSRFTGGGQDAAVLAALSTEQPLSVDEMAFAKGFQLNCPLAPMKAILQGG